MDREQVRINAFNRKRARFGEDLCDLIGPTFVEGGAAGDSVSFGTIATNLECFMYELSGAAAQTVIGGEAFISSHGIELKKTAATQAVTPRHKLRIHARDGKSERFFEKLVPAEDSFTPLVVLKGSLVRQGYQQ